MAGRTGFERDRNQLRVKDIELLKQVHELEEKYEEVYEIVQTLDQTYQNCKKHFPHRRYKELDDMIKDCTTKENMDNLENAKSYSPGMVVEVSALNESRYQGIIRDITEKQKRKNAVERRFLLLHKGLTTLKNNYQNSKQYTLPKRYREMKIMIKALIRNEDLRVKF